jgi:hypothetical protein
LDFGGGNGTSGCFGDLFANNAFESGGKEGLLARDSARRPGFARLLGGGR